MGKGHPRSSPTAGGCLAGGLEGSAKAAVQPWTGGAGLDLLLLAKVLTFLALFS